MYRYYDKNGWLKKRLDGWFSSNSCMYWRARPNTWYNRRDGSIPWRIKKSTCDKTSEDGVSKCFCCCWRFLQFRKWNTKIIVADRSYIFALDKVPKISRNVKLFAGLASSFCLYSAKETLGDIRTQRQISVIFYEESLLMQMPVDVRILYKSLPFGSRNLRCNL